MACPPVTVRVVADLGIDESGDHGDDAVDVCLILDAGGAQDREHAPHDGFGQAVGLGGRLEPWNRALEEQAATRRVGERELDERPQDALHRSPGAFGQRNVVQMCKQLAVAVGEHGVIQRVLGPEVRVQRRLADPDLTGEVGPEHTALTAALEAAARISGR